MNNTNRKNMKLSSIITLAWRYFRENKKLRRVCILLVVVMSTINILTWMGLTYAVSDLTGDYGYMQSIMYSESGYQSTLPRGTTPDIMSADDVERVLDINASNLTSSIRSMFFDMGIERAMIAEYNGEESDEIYSKIRFMDTEYNNNMLATDKLTSQLIEENGTGVLSYGNNFSSAVAQEIILSEDVAKLINSNPSSLIGQTVSLSGLGWELSEWGKSMLDNDTDPNNQHIFQNRYDDGYVLYDGGTLPLLRNYKIVGIISEEYMNHMAIENYRPDYEEGIWLPLGSLDMASLPVITRSYDMSDSFPQERTVITYSNTDYDTLAESVVSRGKVFPFTMSASSIYLGQNSFAASSTPVYNLKIEHDSVAAAKSTYYELEQYRWAGYQVDSDLNFVRYMGQNSTKDTASTIVAAFSAIILAVVLLSYYNALSYDAKNKKSYLGLMQSVGATKRDVVLICIAEVMVMMLFVVAIVTMVSLAISSIVMKFVNASIVKLASPALLSLKLDLVSFPLSTLIVGGGVLVVGMVMVIALSAGYFRKTTTQLLQGSK